MPDETPTPAIHSPLHAATLVGLIPAADMSGILKVSIQTLATWRCKKKGPPSVKLGKRVFYLLNEFTRWMQEEASRQRASSNRTTLPSKKRERKSRQELPQQLDIESYLQG